MTEMEEPTVFIVDDDAAVRDSIQELVESVGLRAESYASGQAFLDAFQPDRSGCLVIDVRMAGQIGPEVDGRTIKLQLRCTRRAIVASGLVKIVMVSRAVQRLDARDVVGS